MSIPHARYLPWIGPRFGQGALGARRLLLLGEAHYTSETQFDDEELTRGVVNMVRSGTMAIRFFNEAARLVEPRSQDSAADREAFWDEVAFYNYIPCLVAATARVRPSREMWAKAPAPFAETLREVAPDRVLVLGKQVWQGITFPDGWRSDPLPDAGDGALRVWTLPEGRRIVATWINHPSSFGFKRERWDARVRGLMGEDRRRFPRLQ